MSEGSKLFKSKAIEIGCKVLNKDGEVIAQTEIKGHVTPGNFAVPPPMPQKKGEENGKRSVGNN